MFVWKGVESQIFKGLWEVMAGSGRFGEIGGTSGGGPGAFWARRDLANEPERKRWVKRGQRGDGAVLWLSSELW